MVISRCPNMAVQEAEENNESQDEDAVPDIVCLSIQFPGKYFGNV